MNGRNSLVAGGLVVLLVLGVVFFVLGGEPKKPEAATGGEVVGGAAPEGEQPAGFEGDGTEARDLVPEGGAPPPMAADLTPGSATGEAPTAAVVAFGKITWVGGTLPEEIDVSLYDSDGTELEFSSTNKEGAYEIRWDEPLGAGWSVGTDTVTVTIAGQPVDLAPDNIGNLPVHLPGEAPIEANLTIGYLPTIAGRVFDRTTGEPIEGAEISAVSTLQAWAMDECYALSEEDGSYTLELEDLPLRSLIVWCRNDEWQAQMSGPQDLAPAASPGDVLRLDFPMDRPVAWRGRITSAVDGLPVEGATITVGNDVGAFSDYFEFEISDEDGRFELDLPEVPVESAWVHVSQTDFAPVALRAVKPGTDIAIVMGPAVTLAGTVTARGTDKPVEGADVQIFFDGETIWGDNALYDEDFSSVAGTFEMTLESAPLDAARVRVDADGFAPFETKLQGLAQSAGPGKQVVKIELVPVKP
jgi:hypothetical protein